MHDAIEHAIDLLLNARHAVALTGAGLSTASGIPDFRSRDTGLWANYNPMEIATVHAFRYRTAEFFNWIRPLAHQMIEAQPNPAHRALTMLEVGGRLATIITQNIDGLHQRAGATDVVELHGNIYTATCVRCYRLCASDIFRHALIDEGRIPLCPHCGNVLKPNVILFGEALPAHALMAAKRAANRCDVMIAAGSSLEVAPASDLPAVVLARHAKLIIINRDPTYLDEQADVLIHADLAEVLPIIAAGCGAQYPDNW
ncbi:MAG TPA: NAD-dependent deacylase [Anaerolineae bacterium]|jgi:NAD-dependent deacetylase|nr:NAD-dependent deacylase [Anaerolineae bacterium]